MRTIETYKKDIDNLCKRGRQLMLGLYNELRDEFEDSFKKLDPKFKAEIEKESFKDKYSGIKSVIIFILHMDYENDIMFGDYQKVCENIHCFDYLRDIVTNKGGEVLERNDVVNDSLWDTSKIKYLG